MTVCAHLPPSLKSVTFRLGQETYRQYHPRGSLPRWSAITNTHIRGRAEIESVQKVAELVEVLGKRIVSSAPRIQIAMTGLDHADDSGRKYLLQVDRDLLNDAIRNVKQSVMERSGGGGLDSLCGK